MTAVTPPTAALTLSGFLFGDRDRAVGALSRALAAQGAAAHLGGGLDRLTSAAARALDRQLASAAADLADIDVSDVIVAGWQRYAALANAAWRTLDEPGSEELVDLATHRIASQYRPRVDVLVDDVKVGSIGIDLDVEVVVRGLVGTVRDAHLTAVEGGQLRLSASLSCLGLVVAAREAELGLDVVLDLGAGVPILPAHGHPAAP